MNEHQRLALAAFEVARSYAIDVHELCIPHQPGIPAKIVRSADGRARKKRDCRRSDTYLLQEIATLRHRSSLENIPVPFAGRRARYDYAFNRFLCNRPTTHRSQTCAI